MDLLGNPFTPAMAVEHGLGRPALDRLLTGGEVRRVMRGVYVGAGLPLTIEMRHRVVALAGSSPQTVVGRTAAWLHGADLDGLVPDGVIPLDRRRVRPGSTSLGDVVRRAGLCYTSGTRTGLDVAATMTPDAAVAVLDGMLRVGAVAHPELVDAALRHRAATGVDLLGPVAAADGRARTTAESLLRRHWVAAGLPTPTPGVGVHGVRVAVGVGLQRFGLAVTGDLDDRERVLLRAHGWAVREVSAEDALGVGADAMCARIRIGYHEHLLAAVEEAG